MLTTGRGRLGSALAGLGLATASFVAVALLAELFLRLVMPVWYRQPPQLRPGEAWRELLHQRSSTPRLAYELRAGMRLVVSPRPRTSSTVLVETNRYGMRDRDPLPDDVPSLFRIAILGDSFTFGLGVAGDLTYPKVLERMLNESALGRRHRFNVLNFGVSGYSTQDEALVLKHKALRWRPRIVVIGYVLNDPETDPIQPLPSYYQRVYWWQHSHLLRRVAQAANVWEVWMKGRGDYFRYLHAPDAGKWRSVERAFEDISLIRPLEVPVIVAILPDIPAVNARWDGYRYRDIHAQVAALARARGFEVVDLLERFSRYETGALRVSPGDGHPSVLGHEVIAEALRARIENDAPSLTGPVQPPHPLEWSSSGSSRRSSSSLGSLTSSTRP